MYFVEGTVEPFPVVVAFPALAAAVTLDVRDERVSPEDYKHP